MRWLARGPEWDAVHGEGRGADGHAGGTAIEARWAGAKPEVRVGDPAVLRGGVRFGAALVGRAGAAPWTHAALVVARFEEAYAPDPEAADDPVLSLLESTGPAAGTLLPSNALHVVALADAPGARLASGDAAGGRFEVDLVAALGASPFPIARPGRYWALVTADGVVGARVVFEVVE